MTYIILPSASLSALNCFYCWCCCFLSVLPLLLLSIFTLAGCYSALFTLAFSVCVPVSLLFRSHEVVAMACSHKTYLSVQLHTYYNFPISIHCLLIRLFLVCLSSSYNSRCETDDFHDDGHFFHSIAKMCMPPEKLSRTRKIPCHPAQS